MWKRGWKPGSLTQQDPYHRIGQLEGAISTALPYFEIAVAGFRSNCQQNGIEEYHKQDLKDMEQVIANLKAIVKEDK